MSGEGKLDSRLNQWAHLVSGMIGASASDETPVKINQDVNMYVTELDEGGSLGFTLQKGRMAYTLCIEGSISIFGDHGTESLQQHDAAQLLGQNELKFDAGTKSLVLIVEMEADAGDVFRR
jgi:redox-sensitive bicupin YhaK (pirin superfamily)